MDDIKPPIFTCNCEKLMEIIEQDHKKNGMIQIKYKCECRNQGMILLRPDGQSDRYLYDSEMNLITYDHGAEDE